MSAIPFVQTYAQLGLPWSDGPEGEAQPAETTTFARDPVFARWFFYDETWSDAFGPYDTEETARQALAEYAGSL